MFCCPCWSILAVLCYVLFHCHVLAMARACWTSHECFLVRKFSERSIWIHQTTSACKSWRSWTIVTKGQWVSIYIYDHVPLALNEGRYHVKLFVLWWEFGNSKGSMILCPRSKPDFWKTNSLFLCCYEFHWFQPIWCDVIWWTQNEFRVVIRLTLQNIQSCKTWNQHARHQMVHRCTQARIWYRLIDCKVCRQGAEIQLITFAKPSVWSKNPWPWCCSGQLAPPKAWQLDVLTILMKYAWVVLVHHIDLVVVASMFIFSAGRFEDA